MLRLLAGPLAALLLLPVLPLLAPPQPAAALEAAAGAAPAPARLVGLRGATTAAANTPAAIREAVADLMAELVWRNRLAPEQVVSATFTATADLDSLFPAAVARRLPGWDRVALLDMQQMAVRGDLPRCIRVLVLAWLPPDQPGQPVYQRDAARLRPDLAPAVGGRQDGRPRRQP